MAIQLNALATAALVAVAAGGANAAISLPGAASQGNSSVLFVAIDANNSVGLTVDLGLSMSDFMQGASRTMTGTSITWNFAANTSTDAAITGNAWSDAFSAFLGTQSGGDYRWGVIAADSVAGSAIAGRGWLATGNPTEAQMLAASTSAPTGNGLTVLNNFYAATNNQGNIATAGNGAAATDPSMGVAWLGSQIGTGNGFGGQLTWNFLAGAGQSSTFQYQQQTVANPVVYQIGEVFSADTPLTADQSIGTWNFDLASGQLSWAVAAPVPEPETYAMLLAGLVAIGAVARRRRNQA